MAAVRDLAVSSVLRAVHLRLADGPNGVANQTCHARGWTVTRRKFPSPLLTRSPGHYRDWIRACKGGDPACSNFNVAAPFVEWMLLGVVALRVEGKLEYDPAKMKFTNNAEANKYLTPAVRKGWSIG